MVKKCFILVAISCLCLFATQAFATSYTFDEVYSGNGNISFTGVEPSGTVVNPGDTVDWTIQAQPSYFWQAVQNANIFPLMAFNVQEGASREVQYSLTLSDQGNPVFTDSETVNDEWVHMGTSTVSLTQGLVFDEMQSNFTLLSSIYQNTGDPSDPLNGTTTTSTISSDLPIFGTPDQNPYFSPGAVIFTSTPLPGALLFLGPGLVGLAAIRRRFKK